MQEADETYLAKIRADNAAYVAAYGESLGYQYSLDMNKRIAFLLILIDNMAGPTISEPKENPDANPNG